MQLLNLSAGKLGAVVAEQTLWTGDPKQPVLATAPGSPYLAVAGNDGHEVLVYSIKDLLNHQGEAQRLHSVGTSFRFAAFVSKLVIASDK